MGFHGLEKIVGAGGGVAASGTGTSRKFEHRIEEPLVKTDPDADEGGDGSGDHGLS